MKIGVQFEKPANGSQVLSALLRDTENQGIPVHKWIIPRTLHNDILRELAYMNIGRNSLFPGIDGVRTVTLPVSQPRRASLSALAKKAADKPFEGWLKWEGWNA